MVSKLIHALIALSTISLFSHENFNQITANADALDLAASSLKLEHLSTFHCQNDDFLLLHLSHSPHFKYFQNDVGITYRKILPRIGLGANLYYMHTSQPRTLIHQISPGLELFYRDFQLSYNLYLPTTSKKAMKKGDLYHNTLSEFGLRWSPRKDLSVGLLPIYDHVLGKWGLNSNISYTISAGYTFGLSPRYNSNGFGCALSFGVSFGSPGAKNKSPHRSNSFAMLYEKKQPKIVIELPKPRPIPSTPAIALPALTQPVKEEPKEEEIIVEPIKPKQDPYWWSDIFFVPAIYPLWNQEPQIEASSIVIDSYLPQPQPAIDRYMPTIIEDYTRDADVG